MSKAGNIPAGLFSETSASSFRRVVGQRPKRRFYLIVCEGKETEPNYFEAIRQRLPKEMVKRVTIEGTGRNTLTLVEYVEKLIEQRRCQDLPPFYEIWVVMDKDSFPEADFDNAIQQIEQHSVQSDFGKWSAAWSNEAFELWYLLHFTEQTGGPIHRKKYAARLKKFLRHPYKKNDPNMFQELQAKTLDAIKRAERGYRNQLARKCPYHLMNPATTVFLLVRQLLRYMA